MNLCPKCGRENTNSKYCEYCGTRQNDSRTCEVPFDDVDTSEFLACSNCGASQPKGTKYCRRCGGFIWSLSQDDESSADTIPGIVVPQEHICDDSQNTIKVVLDQSKTLDQLLDGPNYIRKSVMPPMSSTQSTTKDGNSSATAKSKRVKQQPLSPPVVKKRKKNKGLIWAIGAGSAAVVAVVIAMTIFFSGVVVPFVLYSEQNEIYLCEIDSFDETKITSRFADSYRMGQSLESDDLAKFYSGKTTVVSADTKKLFYTSSIANKMYTLFCKNPSDLSQEPLSIDSNVTSFVVSDDAMTVVYLKEKTNDLYRYTFEQGAVKIDTAVKEFYCSDDGLRVVYKNNKDDIFINTKDAANQTVGHGNIEYISDDFLSVLYMDTKKVLFKKIIGQEAYVLARNVDKVLWAYDNSDVYYLKNYNEKNVSIADSIVSEQTLYNEPALKLKIGSLCYHDGVNEKLITNRYYDDGGFSMGKAVFSKNIPVFAFSVFDNTDKKFNMADGNSLSQSARRQIIVKSVKNYVGYKGGTVEIKNSAVRNLAISDSGEQIIFGTYSTDEVGELYTMSYGEGGFSEPVLYDTNVDFTVRGYYISGKHYVYFKNASGKGYTRLATMFFDKQQVDDKVAVNRSILYLGETDSLYYFVNVMENSASVNIGEKSINVPVVSGALKVFTESESKTINQDVIDSLCVDRTGNLFYVNAYNAKKAEGALKLYADNTSKEVASRTAGVIWDYDRYVEYNCQVSKINTNDFKDIWKIYKKAG